MGKPPVVILCGGEGTRLREETEYKPKAMVTVGGMPIIWHIMKFYSHFGYDDFVLCLGYKGEMIQQFFSGQEMRQDFNITFADTGLKTMTGGRLARVERHIGTDCFLATYGDGVTNANIAEEVAFHKKSGTVGTLLGVHPHSRFGMVKADNRGMVEQFTEKPVLEDYINGGFYVFEKGIFEHLSQDENCVLETGPLSALAEKKQLSMFRHEGFWYAMDTYKDYLEINKMWDEGRRDWKVW
jgi:glucose-1-phosphate cytidylyltransferase